MYSFGEKLVFIVVGLIIVAFVSFLLSSFNEQSVRERKCAAVCVSIDEGTEYSRIQSGICKCYHQFAAKELEGEDEN